MELDQEKLTRNESERSRELAQRIRRELGPCSVQVLGGVGALESALEATGAVQPAEGALPELLVVVDPEWVTLPQQLADRVLPVPRFFVAEPGPRFADGSVLPHGRPGCSRAAGRI